MATLKVHEEDCIQLRGGLFMEIRERLDELFKEVGPDHRGYRHIRLGQMNGGENNQ
jgi:hypothetical protein